jgi:hypothetical protein
LRSGQKSRSPNSISLDSNDFPVIERIHSFVTHRAPADLAEFGSLFQNMNRSACRGDGQCCREATNSVADHDNSAYQSAVSILRMSAEVILLVPSIRPPYAIWAYSWMSGPSRSRRMMSASTGPGGGLSGLAYARGASQDGNVVLSSCFPQRPLAVLTRCFRLRTTS